MLGPRGIEGFFGWTFFDPANLVCVTLLTVAAVLVVLAMRARSAPDVPIAIALYVCLAAFLRGYFFKYYHGGPFGRVVVLLVLLLGVLGSAALWFDSARAHVVLRASGPVTLREAPGFRTAAVLHLAAALTLLLHFVVPRRWMLRATDELADRAGRDAAHDAPAETRSTPPVAEGDATEDRG